MIAGRSSWLGGGVGIACGGGEFCGSVSISMVSDFGNPWKEEFKFLKCILSLLKNFTRNPSKFFDYYYVSSVLAENFVSSFENFSSM